MTKRLKIAMVASNFIRIPPRLKDIPHGYSGAPEAIIYTLSEGLLKKGHDVTLFASGDSKTKAKLSWITKRSLTQTPGTEIGQGKTLPLELLHLSFAYQKIRKGKFNIVHSHFPWQSALFSPFVKTPTVTTIHTSPKYFSKNIKTLLKHQTKNQYYISISNNQRKALPFLNYIDTVYHGIEIKKYKFNPKPDDYFLFVGRIVPFKGVDLAIKMCKRARKKLYIIGDYSRDNDYYINYFKKEVEPYIDQKNIIWSKKWLKKDTVIKFYQKAKALLSPLRWEEPFGLTMIEAMACGTPVISFSMGSAPEIIKNGLTGFLVTPSKNEGANIKNFIEAAKKIGKIKREDCRAYVEKNFSLEKMVAGYEKAYQKILNSKSR